MLRHFWFDLRLTIQLRSVFLGFSLAALSACATVDFDYPKTTSTYATDTDETYFGQRFASIPQGEPGESGFYLLADSIEALAVRLLMAENAEKTIDAQYYLITDDSIGLIFIGALLNAADRGVRVRLLLDDIQTQGYDSGLAALDNHPNIEVRIFNPWASRTARFMDGFSFNRVNRRMHNKSFTVDNQATIIGGRNIANEYFAARDDVNFGDLDVFGIGPVVQDVSTMFDTYWSHRSAVPVPAFAKIPDNTDETLARLRENIEEAVRSFDNTQYKEAFAENWEALADGSSGQKLAWAPYQLVYDSPDKSIKSKAAEAVSITSPLRDAILSAERQVVIISPYFVPLRTGVEGLTELQNSGVQVSVITNGLAANNHAVVHSGYAPSREPLLKNGIKLYEVKANAKMSGVDRGGKNASLATLHTKAFLVDDNVFFLGSFNFDPRSANINTELGVIIESEEIAKSIQKQLDDRLLSNTYELALDDKGKIIWLDKAGDYPVSYKKEPDTSGWDRFKVGFMSLLPIKSQL